MSNEPTLYGTPAALPVESVTVEIERLPDGREAFNVKASAIQHQGDIWERVIHILFGGLRASIAQTCSHIRIRRQESAHAAARGVARQSARPLRAAAWCRCTRTCQAVST
jgi:hypothetical protein